jgi:hypothetical protein
MPLPSFSKRRFNTPSGGLPTRFSPHSSSGSDDGGHTSDKGKRPITAIQGPKDRALDPTYMKATSNIPDPVDLNPTPTSRPIPGPDHASSSGPTSLLDPRSTSGSEDNNKRPSQSQSDTNPQRPITTLQDPRAPASQRPVTAIFDPPNSTASRPTTAIHHPSWASRSDSPGLSDYSEIPTQPNSLARSAPPAETPDFTIRPADTFLSPGEIRQHDRARIPPAPQIPTPAEGSTAPKFVNDDAYRALYGHHSQGSGARYPGYSAPDTGTLAREYRTHEDEDGNRVRLPTWEGPYPKATEGGEERPAKF